MFRIVHNKTVHILKNMVMVNFCLELIVYVMQCHLDERMNKGLWEMGSSFTNLCAYSRGPLLRLWIYPLLLLLNLDKHFWYIQFLTCNVNIQALLLWSIGLTLSPPGLFSANESKSRLCISLMVYPKLSDMFKHSQTCSAYEADAG